MAAAIIALGASLAFTPAPGLAAADAGAKCVAAKLTAAGKYANCILRVTANATARHTAPFFDSCQNRFAQQWSKVESDPKGMCPTQGHGQVVREAVDLATDIVSTATFDSLDDTGCTAAQEKSLGTYLQCSLTAYAKAHTQGSAPDLSRCRARADSDWTAKLNKFPGACFLQSALQLRSDLDIRVAKIADLISGVAPPPATPAPPVCGDGVLNQVTEECDGADAHTCPGACRSDCTCPNQANRVELIVQLAQLEGLVHRGLTTVTATQPVTGLTTYIIADIGGPYATAAFRLVDIQGQPVQSVSFVQNHPLAAATDYVGQFNIPAEPFKVAVSGLTRDGGAYNVVSRTLFTPQFIQLNWDPDPQYPSELPPGGTATLHFTAMNHGAPDSFAVSVIDTLNLGLHLNTTSITLASGASADILVTVSAPGIQARSQESSITLTLTSSSNPNRSTSFTVPVLLE
ncbi:hypothetical protein KF840_23490 [bacterium]|nr:hypothetical protein [bacterium]